MNGETNLDTLIKNMQPQCDGNSYVFVSVKSTAGLDLDKVFASINEHEGCTLVLTKQQADSWGLSYQGVFSLITLQIHSSLDAVGLTAAFSNALAKQNISANVIAGFYHDHVLVAESDSEQAMEALMQLAEGCVS